MNSRIFKANQVVEALSYAEFSRLCALVDTKAPAGEEVLASDTYVRVAGRLREHKFNVLRVNREPTRVRVLIYMGGGFGHTRWCELAA